jgi:hypothetical protein
MQHTHRLVYLANHMFIDLPEGRFLVDTGSPFTFGETGTASYGGTTREIPRHIGPLTVQSLGGLDLDARIGTRLRGVLGMDFMRAETVLWDGPRGRAIVRPPAPPADAERIALQDFRTVPIVEATVGGRETRWIFDTGAQYGFVTEEGDLSLGEAEAEFDDFHPVLGGFRSRAMKAPVELGAVRFRERFGHHAPLSARVLQPARVDGIIGLSWLARRRVWLAAAQGAMWVAAG